MTAADAILARRPDSERREVVRICYTPSGNPSYEKMTRYYAGKTADLERQVANLTRRLDTLTDKRLTMRQRVERALSVVGIGARRAA